MTATLLLQQKCVACRADSPSVTEQEIAELHPQVSQWQIIQEDGIPKLDRVFRFKDFAQSLAFTNAVGAIAEEEGHHPDLNLHNWNKVMVTLSTHAIGGLSENDFILASKIGEMFVAKED